MFPRLGEVEQADDAGVVEPAHDLDFLEDVGALRRVREERARARAKAEKGVRINGRGSRLRLYRPGCKRTSVALGFFLTTSPTCLPARPYSRAKSDGVG